MSAQRISEARLATMAKLCELPRQRGHEPNNVTYAGVEAIGLVLDLRDCRAQLAAVTRERDELEKDFKTLQEMQQFTTPSDPTGVRNGLRFKATEAERDAAIKERDEARACLSSKWQANNDALAAQVTALRDAIDRCDSNRGAFSCYDPHDVRCPKWGRKDGSDWKGEWVCECGREQLDAALADTAAAAEAYRQRVRAEAMNQGITLAAAYCEDHGYPGVAESLRILVTAPITAEDLRWAVETIRTRTVTGPFVTPPGTASVPTRCGFCGDLIDATDPDNWTVGNRTDCGKCVRGMRRTKGD